MTTNLTPTEQALLLSTTAGVRVRDDLLAVEVRGDDRLTWLNGQVTADVRRVAPGRGIYALAVTVRGKIMADLWVLARPETLCVLLPRAAASTVLESFERQIIMDDVTLVPLPDAAVLSIQGPRAQDVLQAAGLTSHEHHACDELGTGGALVVLPSAQLADAQARAVAAASALSGGQVGAEAVELARLTLGRPRFALDFGPENYPQEAGLEKRAVAFDKGCYLGQEVVCTLESRGRLTRKLARLTGQGAAPAPGTELSRADGTVIGKVTSAAADEAGVVHALGFVKHAQLVPQLELHAGEQLLRVLGPAA